MIYLPFFKIPPNHKWRAKHKMSLVRRRLITVICLIIDFHNISLLYESINVTSKRTNLNGLGKLVDALYWMQVLSYSDLCILDSGTIEFDEFVKLMSSKNNQDSEQDMRDAFKVPSFIILMKLIVKLLLCSVFQYYYNIISFVGRICEFLNTMKAIRHLFRPNRLIDGMSARK